jgi:hypothetical protein
VRTVAQRHRLPVASGLPRIDQSLRWGDAHEFYVVGALATLQVGPDAHNLAGCQRAARICADSLGASDPLREQGEPLANIYDALSLDVDDSDDDDDDDSGT